jgi:hypothetical protein
LNPLAVDERNSNFLDAFGSGVFCLQASRYFCFGPMRLQLFIAISLGTKGIDFCFDPLDTQLLVCRSLSFLIFLFGFLGGVQLFVVFYISSLSFWFCHGEKS